MTPSSGNVNGSEIAPTSNGRQALPQSLNKKRLQCDLVMAGGVTSGVVYPQAILRLAQDYTFRSIGGTSAGAIAAAAAAAAEYGRKKGNPKSFSVIEREFGELKGELRPLFQPQFGTYRLFDFAFRLVGAKTGGRSRRGAFAQLLFTLVLAYRAPFIAGATVFALLMGAAELAGLLPPFSVWLPLPAFAATILALIFSLCWALFALWWDIDRLKNLNFGMCPGTGRHRKPNALMEWIQKLIRRTFRLKQKDKSEALMDWIYKLIQKAAGLPLNDPLTFGDLAAAKMSKDQRKKDRGIDLRMMTTNVSLGTGYALPSLGDGRYFFAKDDLKAILPDQAFAALSAIPQAEDREKRKKIKCGGVPLFDLPVGDDMPVVLAVRMSLSFPVLFTAVPLYKSERVEVQSGANQDEVYSEDILFLKKSRGRAAPRKSQGNNCNIDAIVRKVWFSDGGITSNFPVRFFDSLVPTRPTFGVSLEDRGDDGSNCITRFPPDVFLPMPKGANQTNEIRTIGSLPGFLMSVVNSAREWQDRKQARLPGWQERIARLYLDKREGGLNLGMDKNVVGDLEIRGKRAAELLAGTPKEPEDQYAFDFEEHQWRRLLVAHRVFADVLSKFDRKWRENDLKQILVNLQAKHGIKGADYKVKDNDTKAIIDDMAELAKLSESFGKNAKANPMKAEHAQIEIVPRDPIL